MTSDSTTPAAAGAPVRADVATFGREFGRRPFRIEHDLCDHPLLSIERLVELCQRLPASKVEYNAGDLPVTQDPDRTPANGLSPRETIERIETCSSWLVLKYVESVPEYAELLDACVDALARAGGRPPEAFFKRAAFVFVSSPGSMTPLHIDPELNFLLQVRGSKTMHLIDRADREVLDEPFLERFARRGHRNLTRVERPEERAEAFELRPGDGLHVPALAPHFVRNGPEVSVSLSITFHDAESDREHGVRMLNGYLRKAGLRPSPPGAAAGRDRLKYGLFRALRSMKRRSRGA